MSDSGELGPIIEKAVVVALFAALVFGVLMILKPFSVAILFGGILAVASWPVRVALTRRGMSPLWASIVLLIVALLLMIGPIVVVAPTLAADVRALFGDVQDELERGLAAPGWLTSVPVAGPWISENWDRLFGSTHTVREFFMPYSEWLRTTLAGFASSLADSLLQFALALAVAMMLWISGESLNAFLDDVLRRLGGRRFVEFASIAGNAITGSVYGVAGTAVAQAGLMYLGLVVAGIPGAMPLAFVTLILAISQIGTVLIHAVWIGAAWWLHKNGLSGWQFWFIIVWGIVVTHIDGLLKPLLIGKRIQMPMTLVMLAVFGGFLAYGFLGLFIGPAILAVAWALLREWLAAAPMDPILRSVRDGDAAPPRAPDP